jgi:hypothetical protein
MKFLEAKISEKIEQRPQNSHIDAFCLLVAVLYFTIFSLGAPM